MPDMHLHMPNRIDLHSKAHTRCDCSPWRAPQALPRRAAVRPHQPARSQLDAAKVPHHQHRHAVQPLALYCAEDGPPCTEATFSWEFKKN